MHPDTWEKARAYGLDKERFSVIRSLFLHALVTTIELYYGYYGYLWHLSQDFLGNNGYDAVNEYYISLVFLTLINIIGIFKDLPFKLYGTFVLEEKHGFNKQTFGFFVKDQLKSAIVGQILTIPLSAAIIYIVSNGGNYFFVWLWLFLCFVTMVMIFIYPVLIAPLFDKYSPLEQGALRTSIEELAAALKFPLKQLYVVEGSKRSAHSNAYFYGLFGSKRIVLFDTLLMKKKRAKSEMPEGADANDSNEEDQPEPEPEPAPARTEDRAQSQARQLPPKDGSTDVIDFSSFGITERINPDNKGCCDEEVLAVLAHELGHWKHNHFTINMVLLQAHLLLMFVAFANFFELEILYTSVGFYTQETPILIGLVLVLTYVLSPVNAIIQFFMTKASRAFEYQADAFAKDLGYTNELARALVKLNVDNLGFPIYDPLYSAWNHSHPTLFERLAALKDKKKD